MISTECDDLTEIEIEGQHTATLRSSLLEDLPVWQSMQLFVAKVHRVVAGAAQPRDHLRTHTHVGKEAHDPLRRMNFFGREPGRVFERLSNVLLFQIRMILEHLFDARSVSELTNDHGDGDAHATDARATAHDVRIECDALEHGGLF